VKISVIEKTHKRERNKRREFNELDSEERE
jgi:hypothetical protein